MTQRAPQVVTRVDIAGSSSAVAVDLPAPSAVECGVIGCDQEIFTVEDLREHAKHRHTEPAHSVHRASPATEYCQNLIWPSGVACTVSNGLRRLVELGWIDDADEQKVQGHLENRTRGHYAIPLDRIAPHSAHLSEYYDAHSEVLVTIGNAPSPPHIDFYTGDNNPPPGFKPVSGNQLLLSGSKLWTCIPTDFLSHGFKWMRHQMDIESPVSRTWPRATIHPGDETTAAGGEIHAVTQLSDVTFSMGSAFRRLDNTTIPQDRQWLKEKKRVSPS